MRLKKSVLVVIMSLIIIVSSVFMYLFFTTKKLPEPILKFDAEVQDFSSKRIYEVTDEYHIDITYPETNIKVVNDFFNSYIQSEIEGAKSGNNKYLLMNFEASNLNDFFSFAFYKSTGNDENLSYNIDRTYLFDKEGKKIDLDGVFDNNYKKYLAVSVREKYFNSTNISRHKLYKNITNNNSSFQKYFFKKDSLYLYYDEGIITDTKEIVDISIDSLSYYLKSDYQGINTIKKSNDEPSQFRFIDVDKPMIAFTFDDGPAIPQMDKIADIFDKYQSKGTFFVLGNRINENNSSIVKKVYQNGHQIANHSYSHPDFRKLTNEQIKYEVEASENAIKNITGQKDTVVRTPYGSYNQEVLTAVNRAVVHWNVDTNDWKIRDKQHIYNHVVDRVKDGDIILMHELYQSTIDAVDLLLPKLIEEGYQMVTVDELFAFKGIDLSYAKIYFSAN